MAEQRKRRKRGGLAGIWDRNKNVIKPLATLAAGALTGGAALPALLGAGMSGLDRPGRGGIGFDFGGAAKGALTGYGMGKLGQAARSGLQGLFTGGVGEQATGQASAAVPGQLQAPSSVMTAGRPLGGGAPMTGGDALRNVANANVVGTPRNVGGMDRLKNMLGGVGQFARDYAQPLGQAASAVAEYGVGQQQANIARERNELERQRFERERQQQEALAQLLMPLFQQQARRVGGGMG